MGPRDEPLVSGNTGLTADEMDEKWRRQWAPPPELPVPPHHQVVSLGDGAQMRVDQHEADVHDPAIYDPGPAPPADAAWREHSAHLRRAYALSPFVLESVECTGCGARGIYYGRADKQPAEHYCQRCGPPAAA